MLSAHHDKALINYSKKFTCTVCPKSFTRRNNLKKKHMALIHNQGSPPRLYSCEICKQLCTLKEALIGYVNVVHEKLKPHQCMVCNKTLVTNHICTITSTSFTTKPKDLWSANFARKDFCCLESLKIMYKHSTRERSSMSAQHVGTNFICLKLEGTHEAKSWEGENYLWLWKVWQELDHKSRPQIAHWTCSQ